MSIKQKPHSRPLVLRKSRSYRAGFNEAWSLLVSNLMPLLRSLALPSLIIGLVLAVLFALWRVSSPVAAITEGALALLLVLYVAAVMICIVRRLVTQNLDFETRRIRPVKAIKGSVEFVGEALTPFYALVVFTVVLALLAFGAVKAMSVSPYLIIPFIILALLLSVPWNLTLSALLYSDEGTWPCIKNGFRRSWRSFGSTLMLVFLSVVLLGIIFCIAYLPLFILNLAITASGAAVAYGDPTDLPSSVYVLHFALSVILMGFVAFACLIWLLPQWLHFFSILAGEDDRKKEQTAEKDFFDLKGKR